MSVTLEYTLISVAAAVPGETHERVTCVRLPMPEPRVAHLERFVVDCADVAIDDWRIDFIAVRGVSLVDPPAPLPAVLFAPAAVNAHVYGEWRDGDEVRVRVTHRTGLPSRLKLTAYLRPVTWIYYCHGCGASLQLPNNHATPPPRCDNCHWIAAMWPLAPGEVAP